MPKNLYRPYDLHYNIPKSDGNLKDVSNEYIKVIENAGFQVIGELTPCDSIQRLILIITNNDIKNMMKKSNVYQMAGVLRLGLTLNENNNTIDITSTNLCYWGAAYLCKQYSENYEKELIEIYEKFVNALKSINAGSYIGDSYGHKNGMKASACAKFHYMMGMPYFNDMIKLNKFESHDEAVKCVVKKLDESKEAKLIYKEQVDNVGTCIGINLTGERGESRFMPIIDKEERKHTCSLPYELFIDNDGEVKMLHGRYRIALAFPDLTMATFTKIMSTPGDIEATLKSVSC